MWCMILSSCFLIYLPLTRRCSKIWEWSGRHHMRYDLTKWNPCIGNPFALARFGDQVANTYLNSEDRGVLILIGHSDILPILHVRLLFVHLFLTVWRRTGNSSNMVAERVEGSVSGDLMQLTECCPMIFLMQNLYMLNMDKLWSPCFAPSYLSCRLEQMARQEFGKRTCTKCCVFFFWGGACKFRRAYIQYHPVIYNIYIHISLLFITFHSLYHCNRGTGSPTRAAGRVCRLVVTTRLKSRGQTTRRIHRTQNKILTASLFGW